MKTKITLVCAQCARTFEKEPWSVRDTTRYCSTTCRGDATKGKKPKTLETLHGYRDLIEAVDAYRDEHPKTSYNDAVKALKINPNTYYEARRELGLGGIGVGAKEGIKPGDPITRAKPKKIWDASQLRWRTTGS